MATRTLQAIMDSLNSQGHLARPSIPCLREALLTGEVRKSNILKLPGCADKAWLSVLEACDLKQTITVLVSPKMQGEWTSNYVHKPFKQPAPAPLNSVARLFAQAEGHG